MKGFSAQQHAEHVLRLTRNMYALAEEGDWEAFSLLESKRQQVITCLFDELDVATELNQIAGLLNQVIELDAASIRLGEVEKKRMGIDINTFKARKQAATVYQKMLNY
ncbi:MAG: flagellar protein FliT [Gammaproteobacteria bacterium]|nr:flagellar protein FliT [Gammaproteobacteria bacterium]